MTKLSDAEKLARIAQGLKCSEEEAKAVLAYDEAVDHGEATKFDLTPEQERIARKAARADRKTTVYKFDSRKRKPNEIKSTIIAAIAEWLNKTTAFQAENIETVNAERQIRFESNGETFELTLVQKRKSK